MKDETAAFATCMSVISGSLKDGMGERNLRDARARISMAAMGGGAMKLFRRRPAHHGLSTGKRMTSGGANNCIMDECLAM